MMECVTSMLLRAEAWHPAWGRMVEVTRGYRNSQGALTEGSVVATIGYDGLDRRIVKDVGNSGDWDCAYHYYYSGQRMIETRNGSDNVLKQHVWGLGYVDELVQIGINGDPTDAAEDNCETFYWAMQDANYNVLGLVDSSGDLVERYEYTPYGQRQVYISAGTNDPQCMSPILESKRVEVSTVKQPYGLCDIGHQGLMHDKESDWIDNRARYIIPHLNRLNRTDPGAGTNNVVTIHGYNQQYADGMNRYEYERSGPTMLLDPNGTLTVGACRRYWSVMAADWLKVRRLCHIYTRNYRGCIEGVKILKYRHRYECQNHLPQCKKLLEASQTFEPLAQTACLLAEKGFDATKLAYWMYSQGCKCGELRKITAYKKNTTSLWDMPNLPSGYSPTDVVLYVASLADDSREKAIDESLRTLNNLSVKIIRGRISTSCCISPDGATPTKTDDLYRTKPTWHRSNSLKNIWITVTYTKEKYGKRRF